LVAEVWNKHNSGAVDEFVAPDVVMNNAVLALGSGREGYKRALETVFAAFPDVQLTIDDLIAEGDLVAERGRCEAATKASSWASRRPTIG
jgi:predicted ester cyclase